MGSQCNPNKIWIGISTLGFNTVAWAPTPTPIKISILGLQTIAMRSHKELLHSVILAYLDMSKTVSTKHQVDPIPIYMRHYICGKYKTWTSSTHGLQDQFWEKSITVTIHNMGNTVSHLEEYPSQE